MVLEETIMLGDNESVGKCLGYGGKLITFSASDDNIQCLPGIDQLSDAQRSTGRSTEIFLILNRKGMRAQLLTS